MKDYRTTIEKAQEWNITARHVQYLCRTGRVEGAIKRAGAWFVPDDTPVPTKNTKSNAKDFEFVGTKNRIFSSAIDLFMRKGFSNVSFKDIANEVGIRQSTIYNHFKSKQELLDIIYDYYCHYYLSERLNATGIDAIIQKGSLADILGCIRYEFKDEYRQAMTDITKIILQRIGEDKRALIIAKSLVVDEGIKYVEYVFDSAIGIGRLAPFDTHLMAVFINIVRIFTLYYWIIDTSDEEKRKILEDEQTLYQYALMFIVDLQHPDAMR